MCAPWAIRKLFPRPESFIEEVSPYYFERVDRQVQEVFMRGSGAGSVCDEVLVTTVQDHAVYPLPEVQRSAKDGAFGYDAEEAETRP